MYTKALTTTFQYIILSGFIHHSPKLETTQCLLADKGFYKRKFKEAKETVTIKCNI